ncbi:unnamed protein product [Tetraodon nigroviridis]|uniref:(spotted green pufferfish) hypothetical protein n=1 Tax=Tetraodon nigroviridis TaxID=99883 RepID=Q4RQY5_TETNG|nr:unnamed protein product [Tetraodon nigroviridis]
MLRSDYKAARLSCPSQQTLIHGCIWQNKQQLRGEMFPILSPRKTPKHHMMKVNFHQEKSAESGMENTAALMMITQKWGWDIPQCTIKVFPLKQVSVLQPGWFL